MEPAVLTVFALPAILMPAGFAVSGAPFKRLFKLPFEFRPVLGMHPMADAVDSQGSELLLGESAQAKHGRADIVVGAGLKVEPVDQVGRELQHLA